MRPPQTNHSRRIPPCQQLPIDALNMTVPGYYAHTSATKGGETVKIPQYAL